MKSEKVGKSLKKFVKVRFGIPGIPKNPIFPVQIVIQFFVWFCAFFEPDKMVILSGARLSLYNNITQ